MQRVKLGLVCLSWLCLASAVSAQTELDPASNSGIANVQNISGGGMLNGTYFDVRHVIGDGVGYQNSYSQIGAFTPFWLNEDAFIAPNTRLIVTNSTQIGFNTGAVARQYVNGLDRIFGVYGYYDNDQDSRNFRYNQFTIGAETLGQWWDARANGYFVTGTDSNFMANLGVVGGNPFYFGNSIGFTGHQLRDQALSGADAEVGVPVSQRTTWLRTYAGLYGYHANSTDTVGVRARLEAMVSNDLTLGMMVTNDAIYGTNINGTIDFKFSGFLPTRYFPNMTTRQRMLNPVQRNWRIATRTVVQNVEVPAFNPVTDKPYFIVHVDNSKPPGGDGTIEHPFNHLVNAPQADIILVHRGFATTAATAVTGSTILSNNERLLGDGLVSTLPLFAHFGSSSISETINLPGTSNTGIYPYITNPVGNIVTLANNNEVFALNLVNSGGSAITNTAAGSRNFLLHNLEIFGNAGNGIDLNGASGVGVISSINVGTQDHLNPLGIGNNAGGGIQVSSAVPGLFLSMTNVNMNANPAGAQAYGVSLTAATGSLSANFNNVFTNGNTTGILLNETSQQLIANMNFVRSENNTGAGINIEGTGGSIAVNGTNVGSLNNGSDNLQIGTQAAPIVTSTVGVTFNSSNFSGSKAGSGIVFSLSGGFGTLNLPAASPATGTNVSGNVVDGLTIFATNGTLMNANIQNALFSSNGRDAFHVEAGSASTVNLKVDPTDATRSGRDGLYFALGQDSVFNTMFLNDNLNNSGSSAVFGTLTDFATVNLFFDQTSGRNSGADGFSVNAMNNSLANLEVDHGTFAGSGRLVAGSSAIIISSDNSRVNLLTDLTLGNNIGQTGVVGNQAYGLTLNIANSSVFTGNIYNGDFSDALVDAVKANVTSGSDATLTLLNTPGNRSGLDGFVANVDNANLTANLTHSNFNNSVRNGMYFNVTNAGQFTANITGSTIDNSGASGIYGLVSGANSVANLNLVSDDSGNSFVNSSGDSGLNFNVNGGSLNVMALSSSFSNNGLGGVTGSGVLGVVNNGVFRMDFINTAVDSNLDNGIFVTATNASSVQAAFSLGSIANNGTGTLTPHNNDGILLQLDNSGFSTLSVFNNTQILGNGNDGIAIVATNFTNFQGVFDNINIINNGTASPPFAGTRAGFDVTTASNSQVNLSFDGVKIGNSAPGGSQFEGILSNTITGGLLNASIVSADLQNNQVNALNAAVTSNGIANFTLVNVTGDNNGNTGALFNVTSGGNLTVAASVNTTFSTEGGSGILVQVDGANSVANFDLLAINLSNNGGVFGGQGFSGLATNGGTLNACIDSSNLTNNANQGIELIAANANSTINFNISGSTVDFNSSQGLLINVTDQATVNYRSQNTTYNNNGANGGLDGVSVTAIGNGPADSATARLLFSGDSMSNNTGNGISLDAENGATMTTTLQSVTATANGGYGLMITANGANTKFNLLMSGNNDFSGNALGPINPLSFSNMDQVVLDLSGTFDNSSGDGIHVDMTNVNNAVVAVTGPGTINGSAQDGININFLNVNNGSVLIEGVSSISNSGADGIHISFDTVAQGAISVIGPTQIDGSGADGIDITVANSTLVDNLSFGAANIQVLTLTDNLNSPPPLNGCLPAPVTFTLDSTGLVSTHALLISGISVDNSANTGVNILTTNSSVQTLTLTSNVVATSNGAAANTGDGIHFDMTNTPVTTLNLVDNQVGGAKLNGVNFDLNASPIGTVNIAGNSIGLVSGGGSILSELQPLILPGFTGNTLAANDDQSTGAVPIGFAANFFGTTYNNLFVNNNGNVTFNGPLFTFTPFSLLTTAVPMIAPFFADVDTRAGNTVTFGTTMINGHRAFGVDWLGVQHFDALVSGLPTNSFQLVMIDRSDIAPGDFDFEFNYQSILWEAGAASGANAQGLGGFSARAGYSNGTNTSLELPGSAVNGALLDGGPAATALIHNHLNSTIDGRYVFDVRNGQIGGPSPDGSDGIRLNATNSDIGALNVNNNTIENSGKHGIELLQANSNFNNQIYSHNTITNNGGDGIRMVNPITSNNTITAAFTNNNISSNGGIGVNLNLVAGQQNLQASFASNTISSNGTVALGTGGGINIQLADNRNMTGGFDGNTINLNGSHGVNFNMGVNGQITSDFTGNSIIGNQGTGINIALNTGGHFEGANFYGNTIGANDVLGVRLQAPDQASFNWNLGDSTKAANLFNTNEQAGTGIEMSGSATGNLHVANTTFQNTNVDNDGDEVPGFSGQGLAIRMTGTSTLDNATIGTFNAVNSVATNDVTFAGNAGDGLSFFATGNSKIDNLLITNVNAERNTGDGISFFRQGQPIFNNITIQNSQITGNTGNGIHIVATNALLVDTYTINSNNISTNTADGILMDARFDSQIVANIAGNTINGNTGNGIHTIEQQNAPSDNRSISGTWTLNTITNNVGNGIEIDARTGTALGGGTLVDNIVSNTISNNKGIGINVAGVDGLQTVNIQNNMILSNGAEGVNVGTTLSDAVQNITIDSNTIQHNFEGIELIAEGGSTMNASIDNSSIRFNTGDGIQIAIAGQRNTGNFANITIGTNNPNGNDISDNGGFGINVLNDINGNAGINIQNNNVLRNGLTGIYIVNTASGQNQELTYTLSSNGNPFDNTQMKLVVNNNAILDNGHLATGALFSDVTGLYVRIGTNGASNSYSDPGGFASDASNVNSITTANLTGRGGVLAMVTNNIFGGNAGHDVSFESFKSTPDPATTTGTWTDGNKVPITPVFNVTSYTSDPLARLDLRFTGNVGQDADVTRSGSTSSPVAAYNNAEPVFKSRIDNNPTVASPPGPFDSPTRQRNATRLASNDPPFNDPITPPSAQANGFLYPGVGASTFRVTTDSDFNNGANANTNTFAATPTTFNSAVPLGVLFGELPFVWQTNLAP